MSGAGLAQPDITLHVDEHGVIRDASVSDGISGEAVASLVGRPWGETVSGGGDEKVRQMLDDARVRGVSLFSRVLQRFPSGRELPIEYTTVRVPGEHGGIIALGRNMQAVAELQSRLLAAQQASEREYWKLRDIETRYRLLFDASNEAVLMVDADDLRIVEANPTAIRLLGVAPGWDLSSAIPAREREGFLGMLQRVREHGRAPGLVLHMGAAMAAWAVRASLMPSEPSPRYLLHVAPAGGAAAQSPTEELPLDDLIDRLPDGFVIANSDGTILRANQAFLDLAQVGTLNAVRGEKLGRWLSEPGADASVLLTNLQRHESVRLFQTTLVGELGTETKVEISAACSGQHRRPVLRHPGARYRPPARWRPVAGVDDGRLHPADRPGIPARDGAQRGRCGGAAPDPRGAGSGRRQPDGRGRPARRQPPEPAHQAQSPRGCSR